MRLSDATRSIRRLSLAVGLTLVGIASFDKFVELIGGRFLDRWDMFGAARLLEFANTLLLLAIALYLWEILREIRKARVNLEVMWSPPHPNE